MSVVESETPSGVNAGASWARWETVRSALGPLILFLINLFLVHPLLTPGLTEIGMWDEAGYINSGRAFAEGVIPGFAANPLTAFFYALTYLPFRNSGFWFVYSDWLGRFLLFGLLWLSLYLISKELPRPSRPVAVMGLMLVAPLAIELIRFPSDALFAALAGFSFWQVLRLHNLGRLRNLVAASAWMGLAALARNDGLVLEGILVISGVVIARKPKAALQSLLASVIPFALIVAGSVVLAGLRSGDFSLGVMGRTYDNFESGQMVIYSGTGQMDLTIEAHAEARRHFGTPEENGYSVFWAIARNPGVYFQRLAAVVRELPRTLLYAYGIRFSVPIFLLAARGLLELIRQRKRMLAFLLILWPAHLASGFLITLFREGHLRFPYYAVFALAGIGVGAVIERLSSRREVLAWSLVLAGFALYAILDEKAAILYGAAVLLIGLLVGAFLTQRGQPEGISPHLSLSVLLAAGLVIHGGYPSPEPRRLGEADIERAVLYLEQNFEEGTLIAAGAPGVIWAARMRYLGMTSGDVPIGRPPEGFLDWLRDEGAVAVYVDDGLRTSSPRLWELLEPLIGHGLEEGFVGEQDDVLVLYVTPGP